MQNIHPDDLPHFINFEATVTQFWKQLPPEKVMKYKSRYDYRIRKKDGTYIRIMQQIVTIQSDDEGARSEEHTSELQSLMRISYAVFCLKKKPTTISKNKSY